MNSKTLMLCMVAIVALVYSAGCEDSMKLSSEHEEAASIRSPLAGKMAPDFVLMDQDEKPVKLSGLRGKWVVLYFYPKDDTPGCTCQATEFTELIGDMRDMNAKVYGISADSPETHNVFIQKYDLGLDLLSDRDRKVMKEYGAWMESSMAGEKFGRTIRTTFIIGPAGRIRRHWPEVIPEGHAERVKNWLVRLEAAEK